MHSVVTHAHAHTHTPTQTHTSCCGRRRVSSHYSSVEFLIKAEGWSRHGVFCLWVPFTPPLFLSLSRAHIQTRTRVHTHAQTHSETAPEVLIIQAWPLRNPVLQLRWDDIKRLPLPFELALFCWEFDRSGEEEEEPCLAILSAEPTSRPRLGSARVSQNWPVQFFLTSFFFFFCATSPPPEKFFWQVVRIVSPPVSGPTD